MTLKEESLPHEDTLDILVAEEVFNIERTYGTNPHVIAANLGVILKDFGLVCVSRGTGEDTEPDADTTRLIEEVELVTLGASTVVALTEEGEI